MPFDQSRNALPDAGDATATKSDERISQFSNYGTLFYPQVLNARGIRPPAVSEAAQQGVSTAIKEIAAEQNLGIVRHVQKTPLVLPREIVLQEWEGQVQEVRRRYFTARLVDLTAGETVETEEVDLLVSDVTESDRDLLVPGAIFRWIIGYRYVDGQKERFTRLVIRRLPMWTTQEIKTADEEALELHHVLFGDAKEGAAGRRAS